MFHCFNVRSNEKSVFKLGFFSNIYLNGAVLISAVLQLIVVALPVLNDVFKVTRLNLEQWVIVGVAVTIIIPVVEFVKMVQRKNTK